MKKQTDNHTKSKKKASASSMRLALENRLLFDGAVVATAAQVMDDKAVQDQAQGASKDISPDSLQDASLDTGDTHNAFGLLDTQSFDQKIPALTSAVSAGSPAASTLYIVDSRTDGILDLLAHPASGHPDKSA